MGNFWYANNEWTSRSYLNFNDDKVKLNANDANYTKAILLLNMVFLFMQKLDLCLSPTIIFLLLKIRKKSRLLRPLTDSKILTSLSETKMIRLV
jgi:hypothetical protein